MLATVCIVGALLAPLRPTMHVRRCAQPAASARIANTHRKHALQKQADQRSEELRAQRAQQEQEGASLKEQLASIEEFEVSRDWRAALRALHDLRKLGIQPDIPCIEAVARTLGASKRWKEAAQLAHEMRDLGPPSDAGAAAAMIEAFARRGSPEACLSLLSEADRANLRLPGQALETALRAAVSEQRWEEVVVLHRRIYQPSDTSKIGPPHPPETLFSVIRAHGHLGQWRQAVRLAAQASRRGVAAKELWPVTAAAVADCAESNPSAARTAHRLLAIHPTPEVSATVICALTAARLWEVAATVTAMALVGAYGEPCFAEPRGWDAAVAASCTVENSTLALKLARCRRSGGSREAHAAVLTICGESDEWVLALEHLPHARPLYTPADGRAWLMGLLAAAKAGQHALVIELIHEMGSSLGAVRADLLEQALTIGVDAAERVGQPMQGLRMLTNASPRTTWPQWEAALAACIDAGHAEPVIDALLGGPATELAATETGRRLLADAASAYLQEALAAPSLQLARSILEDWQLSSLTQGMCLGAKAADMAKASLHSIRSGGPPLDLPEFDGRRSSLVSVGAHLSGLRDVDLASPYLAGRGKPPPKRSHLAMDMISLMGFEPTPARRQITEATARSFFATVKKLRKNSKTTPMPKDEAEEVEQMRKMFNAALNETLESGSKYSSRFERSLRVALDLLKRCSERDIDLQLDASIMSLLLFTEGEDPSAVQEVMEEMMQSLCEEEVASLPGFIAALALLAEHEVECRAGNRARWTQVDARLFLAATDQLCSFLEKHKEGSAEERVLAYGLLAQLLANREWVRTSRSLDP